jgi:hypothetical protein
MKNKLKIILFFLFFAGISNSFSQIIYPQGGQIGALSYVIAKDIMPEHGFLSGKKFPTYSTVDKYDFKNIKLKVILYDSRDSLKLNTIFCSNIPLTNTSEFEKEQGISKVWEYINKLFLESNIIIDKNATQVLEIHLAALDSRLIGFGQISAHGLCQIDVKYKNISKTYCTDIEDGDKNAPLSKTSFVSRKTATRYMASSSIRETIEKFLKELRDWDKQTDLTKVNFSGGDGSSVENAILIKDAENERNGVAAEYDYIAKKHGIKFLNWKPAGQSTINKDDKKYDSVTIQTIPKNEIITFYFDISDFYGK